MIQHGGMEMEFSGGTSTERFGDQFTRLDNNPAVKTIVIEGHSPGGQAWGTSELSDLIFNARKRNMTRIVTSINSQLASAAVWAGTSAHEVWITPGGEIGSVGCVVMHRDVSKAEENVGVKTTLIATPAKKVAGHPFEPLGEDVAAELLANCEKTLGRFVGALARNRGVSEAKVRSDFGGGGMLRAEEAKAAGLVDGVATFREVLAAEVERLKPAPPRGGNAMADARAIALAEVDDC
jgi:ClpP class serine protease